MDFYNNLQLDPFVLKKKIHNSTSAKDRKILFATMLIRSLLIVGFAILFISTINVVFGAENSFLAVVLFCMLLSIRFVHFGYKLSHSIISIAIILGIIYMIPIVAFIPNIFLKMLINFLLLGVILLLTSYEPKMGNPGLYSFSYVFLTGTSIKLTTPQLQSRFALIVTTAIVFSIIFIYKHHAKKLNSSIKQKLFENGAFDKKNLWLLTYALGISIIILFGDIFSIRRFMWVGIAFSSLISIYEQTDIKQRLLDRIIGVVAGSILFFILATVIPPTALGIIGGVALGLCTTYRF
ncbi:FUSC family protein [Companilactobacillus sp.]|uniref:FUSC family protein n=1 Tax=Companilactobacillus sp. TaxID=2767905 RepID=UPI0026275266|nr:FUSC family protein [Companilactobacillus sp.]